MLTIKREENNEEIKAILDCDDNTIIMTARDNKKLLGAGTLTLKDYKVYLDKIVLNDDNDLSLKLGIAKSLLNLADLKGIKVVYGENKELYSLYKMLKFKEIDGMFVLELEGYFTCEH